MKRLVPGCLIGLLLSACSGSPVNSGSSGTASGGSSGVGGSGRSASGSPSGSGQSASGNSTSGNAGASGVGAGSGGVPASGSSAGSGASQDAGTDLDASPASGSMQGSGSYPAIVDGGPCVANALFCDNFEEYDYVAVNPPILTELLPNWQQYSFHGYPRVDPSKPFLGKQSAALDTEASSYRFAGFVRETPDGVPVAPLAHFGRVMVFVKALPTTTQWNIIELNGLLAGSTSELATYGIGGMGPLVNLSYTQRPRQLDPDGGPALRAGGPQNAQENALAKANCTKNATTEMFPTSRWVCVEWNFDATSNQMHLWLDGAAQTEVDVDGAGTACVSPAPAATTWQGPAMFTKIALAWEAYGTDSPQQNVWYDEFAMGDQARLGCPTAP